MIVYGKILNPNIFVYKNRFWDEYKQTPIILSETAVKEFNVYPKLEFSNPYIFAT